MSVVKFSTLSISFNGLLNLTEPYDFGEEGRPEFIKWEKYKDIFPVETLSPAQSVSIYTQRPQQPNKL